MNSIYLGTVFYFYVLVKCKFRMELVQSNGVIGFSNFYLYQDRKDRFIDNDKYLSHARTFFAAVHSKQHFHIDKMDLRFRPDTEYRKLAEGIEKKQNMIKFAPKSLSQFYEKRIEGNTPVFWLTAHFIKIKEDAAQTKSVALKAPRQYKLREEVRHQTLAIVQLRMTRNPGAFLLKAVDGANSEIGCRPEIFAQAIRCLRDHTLEEENHARRRIREIWRSGSKKEPTDPKKLKIKFHCGEDS